jgi:parallel beta-helix repeat protein
MSGKRCWAIIGALVTFAALGSRGGEAVAASVACGDTITVDTTLQNDLIDCPGDGLVIGASGITLDLNGHVIDGNPRSAPAAQGIRSSVHDRVTIRGGTVQDFRAGVFMEVTRASRIVDVETRRTTVGIAVSSFFGGRIARNSTLGPGDEPSTGIFLSGDDNVVALNRASNTSSGVFVSDANRNRIARNLLTGNGAGIRLDLAAGNEVVRNTLMGNGIGVLDTPATHVSPITPNVIKFNLFARNSTGVAVIGDEQRVVRNKIAGTPGPGCTSGGIDVSGSGDLVAHNRIEGACVGISIATIFGGSPRPNFLADNVVLGARADGITTSPGSITDFPGAVLSHNVVRGAGGDGIHIDDPRTTLTGNIASRNGDFGIEAVPGVVDGGGNRASRNGNPAECLNVLCGR